LADLITHTCSAVLWKAAVGPGRDGRTHVATFVAGVCAPDLLSRVPSTALMVLHARVSWVPEGAIYLWGPLHMPFGIVLGAFLLAYAFPLAERPAAMRALTGGGLLHLALDVLQRHLGEGYLLLYPFSTWDWEAGMMSSEATVTALPVVLPLTLAAAWWRWGRSRIRCAVDP
jgi:hypothetical protein